MDFLGIGLPELVVILVLALIVVGPKRLPEAAAQIARAIREVRRYSAGMTQEFTEIVKEIETEYTGLKGELKEAGREMRRGVEAVSGELTGAAEEARQGLTEAARGEMQADVPVDTSPRDDAAKPPAPQSGEEH
jgi:Tat protein translocase TatB subunit